MAPRFGILGDALKFYLAGVLASVTAHERIVAELCIFCDIQAE